MSYKLINKNEKLIFNSIPYQNLYSPGQLTIQVWNDTINVLKLQTNELTRYLKILHEWFIGNEDGTIETPSSFAPYVLNALSEYSTLPEQIQELRAAIDDTSVRAQVAINTEEIAKIKDKVQPKIYLGIDVFTKSSHTISSSTLVGKFNNIYNYYYGLDKEDENIRISYPFIIYNFRVDSYSNSKNNYMEATIRSFEDGVFTILGYDEYNIYHISANTTNGNITYYYEPKRCVNDKTLIFQ